MGSSAYRSIRFFLVSCFLLAAFHAQDSGQVSQRPAQNRSGSAVQHRKRVQCATGCSPPRQIYSRQQEEELGDTLAREIENRVSVFEDPILDDYLAHLSSRLAFSSDIHFDFRVCVLQDSEINAYSVPGHVYLNTGLILAVQSEAELAGTIAHELGHLAAHDSAHGLWRAQHRLPLRQFKRNSEFEADRLAVSYLDAAGYDPLAFSEFIERMWPHSGTESHSLIKRTFEIDPPAGQRTTRIRRIVLQSLRFREQYIIDTSEFHAMQLQLSRGVKHEGGNDASQSGSTDNRNVTDRVRLQQDEAKQ